MNKILKPYTIIPPELYIERDADRQVDNIIRDMGRPGYVLVSRQMGKTNLLLNAKRRLENEETIFGYIDLSNPFENVRGCFENIVDTVLETNEDILSDVQETIKNNRRQQNDTPPFKQHTNELRLILKHIKGKLIIILDEIDALTKKNYSDQIFAQIRSVYFSRANYKELENLTYILSGVVEPNEIIKDPKISPFNIGEKIFLNDFSKNEFEQFVGKSKLQLTQTNKDRIFFWTNGNPRITWDVCAEIENRFSDKVISQSEIDYLISEMYLTTFDRPPIDNIRELVKNDRELRNAIIEIAYKKGNEVSDKIKSKLYLSGITNFNGNNDVHIKNEVIKQSLSLDWIKQIEEEDKGLIKLALEFYEKEDYSESLSYFKKFLENNSFESRVESLYYYFMGSAAYHISDFQKALEYLNLTKFNNEDNYYYISLNLNGLVNFYSGNIDESLSLLQSVIDTKQGDEIYVRALLNYGSIAIKSDINKYADKAIKIFEDVTNEVGFETSKLEEDFIREVKAISFYNLAQINGKKNKPDVVIEYYESSLKLSRPNMKPIVYVGLYNAEKEDRRKNNILTKIINEIVENELHPVQYDPEKQMTFNLDHLKEILILSFLRSYSDFEKLKPWLHFLGEKSLSEHLYDLGLFSIHSEQDWNTAIAIFNKIYNNFNNNEYNVDEIVKFNTLQLLAFVDTAKRKEYISLFSHKRIKQIDYLDFSIFANYIATLINQKQYNQSLKYIHIINSVKNEISKELQINYLAIYNLELNAHYCLKNYEIVRKKAKEILDLCNDETIKKQKSNLLGDTGLETIRKNAESVLYPQIRDTQPIVVSKTYGRNDFIKVKYKDDRIIEKIKYKKVEDDINQGKCIIVNE
ncbi:MAG: tetratricopeptide repeat protein [Mycoplasmataceae bacterium]|jgi:hypothetical protein|nr:tetratricopeptide repeat protein [Mycoplasmataceae bacterium]